METRCAGRTSIGGSKSEGRREACRVPGANVVGLQSLPMVLEPIEQSQVFAGMR